MEENRKSASPGGQPDDQGRRNQEEMDLKKDRIGRVDIDQNISSEDSDLSESGRDEYSNRTGIPERDSGPVL